MSKVKTRLDDRQLALLQRGVALGTKCHFRKVHEHPVVVALSKPVGEQIFAILQSGGHSWEELYRSNASKVADTRAELGFMASNIGCEDCLCHEPGVLRFQPHENGRSLEPLIIGCVTAERKLELLLQIQKCSVLCGDCERRREYQAWLSDSKYDGTIHPGERRALEYA